MKIKLLREDLKTFDGIIVIYNNIVEKSDKKDFYELSKVLAHKHKLKESDVFEEGINLFYKKKGEEVLIKTRRKEDLLRISRTNIKELFRSISSIL